MNLTKSRYENFPLWIVLLTNLFSITIYLIGLYIMLNLSILFAALYIAYIVLIETRLLAKSCKDCYYYGKVCAFGKGKCSALFFKKGKPENFLKTEITMKDIIPDFLTFIFPLIGGIVLLLSNFSWLIIVLLVILVILGFAGNAVVRGSFACKYCKQREIGCPAEKPFNKKKSQEKMDEEVAHSNDSWKRDPLFWAYSILMFLPIIMVFVFYNYYTIDFLVYTGWILLVFSVFIIFLAGGEFRKKGGAPKGKSIVHTKVVVESGIYEVVRHPQYLGFILFVLALVMMSQHWLGVISWIMGSTLFYRDVLREEQMSIAKFGDDYKRYMQKVPRMNFVVGVIRWLKRRKS